MSTQIILVESRLAQASPQPEEAASVNFNPQYISIGGSGFLLLLLIGFFIFHQIKMKGFSKKLSMEEFRYRDLHKKYKLAVTTISKMEKNPDLIHSRDFNLDYLRMRMAEEVFRFVIVNQIKATVKTEITVALRPSQAAPGEKPGASAARQVDSIFDVKYETGEPGEHSSKKVLFRISIKLMKLPTQATSQTINQIIDCLETYLSPGDDRDNWTPTIQGRIVHIDWDQKAKPTPLLVLEQSNDGGVLFKTQRPASNSVSSSSKKGSSSSRKTSGTKRSGSSSKNSTKGSKVRK